ncbi:hypothetical protein RHMOL_Rhmol12G0190700 [Rhododendron molle]|uniref:Uncharacterized protein n=1 Tax=Rhododendron molle TaxID=49168 RepID=A0ACC0LKS8_RHOML|nr:hypothetical protein RHMOL_Rhmol12G0190700 [Rhododendron molle]
MGSLEPRGMIPNSPNDSVSSNSRSSGPAYFVTEPGDSPGKTISTISPFCFGPLDPIQLNLTITPLSPKTPPSQPNPTITTLSPKPFPRRGQEEVALYDVFDRLLRIKRKADNPPTSPTKLKALKLDNHSYLPIIPLTEPTPALPNSHPYNTRAAIKKHFVPKKKNPNPGSTPMLLGPKDDGNLVDVSIIQVNAEVEEDCEEIVKANWTFEGGINNVSRVVQNLVRCKKDLQAWHKKNFSKMKDQIAMLKLWDEEKVESLFPWQVVNAIKSTPISWSGGEDKLTWVHSSPGNFSVKSGYHLAFQSTQEKDRGQDSSPSELNSILWKKIWNLKSPPRLKHFLWRIIRNAVSTKENLYARKCARSPICGICGAEIETIEHVLLRCEWTKEVWANSGIQFPTPVNRVVSVKKWFISLLGDWGGQFSARLGLIAQICWAIWKQRNDRVFLQQKPNAKVTIKRALSFHGEFLAATCAQINVPARNHGDSNVPQWQRPLNGSWKLTAMGPSTLRTSRLLLLS